MAIRVRIACSIVVDPEEYPVPTDGDVTEDFEEYVKEFFYDIDGTEITSLKVKMEK
jgi:hypothetical protein|tara:strand:+ start:4197 stop:4364 length:168 start_codon:yes stop_codon:yes gene_type:complete